MSTAPAQPGCHSPACAAAALIDKLLLFRSSPSARWRRPLKDVSHTNYQAWPQPGLHWVLSARHPKWEQINTATVVPEEAFATEIMLLRKHMQSKCKKHKPHFLHFPITSAAVLPLCSTILYRFPQEEQNKIPAAQN